MFKIGEFSSMAKTTVKTLRFYDDIGLFKPDEIGMNGYRYYSIESLNKLQFILELKNYGLMLEDIKKINLNEDTMKVLLNREKILKEQIKLNETNLSLIQNIIIRYKKGEIMKKYVAKQQLLKECIVYYKHGIIESMENLTPFILEAGEECRKNNPNLKCLSPEYCFVTYGAKEFKQRNIEVEYAEAVEDFGKESENIKFKKLPQTKAICIEHIGKYSDLGKAYAYAINWVKEKGYTISDDIRENYVHGCWDTENEDEYLTIIQVPVK